VTAVVPDPFAAARAVADAVLYEGYLLYPYRASSQKNQVRWQFGVLTPRAFSEADGAERWSSRTECLVESEPTAVLRVRVRALHLQRRTVETPTGDRAGSLELDGRALIDWDEGVDVVVDLPPIDLAAPVAELEHVFRLNAGIEVEEVHDRDESVAGRLVRRREAVDGRVRVCVSVASGRFRRITVIVENATSGPGTGQTRDDALARSLIAVHTMLAVDGGRFVSMLDPEPAAAAAAADCHSDGTYPVLIEGDDVVLSSPIILYDHPKVAPESPGDLYDATEIDEILALRVMTLTDAEKAEARHTDPRAAAVIDRCDDFPPEIWQRLHGALRSVGGPTPAPSPDPAGVPWWDPGADESVDPATDSVIVRGVELRRGSQVCLRPSRRADAQDLFLKDRAARVAGVYRDVEDNQYVAVTLDDDPASSELEWQGRYFYFYPDELEPK
jgi:hypothetical protein